MATIGKISGPKKKNNPTMPPSKVGADPKSGQTIAAPGYKMGLIRNQKAIKDPTKKYTIGTGPASASFTTQQGIIGPKPTGPGGKAAAAPAPKPKRSGKSDVGKFISNVGDALTPNKGSFNLKKARRSSGRGNRGGGPLKCFGY